MNSIYMRLCKEAIDKKEQWVSEEMFGINGENNRNE